MRLKKILIANRGEIAIRIARAIGELGLKSVAVYSREDRLALHRLKADEAYPFKGDLKPIDAYLDIAEIIGLAKKTNCDAIHPGYGFLSENPKFAQQCIENGLVFIGPSPGVIQQLGDKLAARQQAIEADIPVIPASAALPRDKKALKSIAHTLGFPLMLKAGHGGGGRGMRIIRDAAELMTAVDVARQEAKKFFSHDAIYLEKLFEHCRHVEVQIIGDTAGNIIHLYERDCSLQRRHQKILERSPAPYLTVQQRGDICDAAIKLARHAKIDNVATVEFLFDPASGKFYFLEVNPRIQVEHTVTEEVTGIDIVKTQIWIASGQTIGGEEGNIPVQAAIRLTGSAMQCRVTTEDPHNSFIPSHGHIVSYMSPSGPGIRLDGGTAYSGALITHHYDSLLVKVTARGRNDYEAMERMRRALLEFRIRGIATNLPFLEQMLRHPNFLDGQYSTDLIDSTPALFDFSKQKDPTLQLASFIGNINVNGNPQVRADRPRPAVLREPVLPPLSDKPAPAGVKQIFERDGADGLLEWIKERPVPLVTDTTFRDAHQSLFATRMRTHDMLRIAPHYAASLPGLFSVESWGGATFDVALRFLHEDPWERIMHLSAAMPNVLQQMLLRGANAVGYTNYADNVVSYFIHKAADAGIDVFRIFDSLNWAKNMELAIQVVRKTGKLAEATICYTGDILDPARSQYDLAYYVSLAKDLESMGAHILGIKDMAGLLRPDAARLLIEALKQAITLPIHLHTHDTAGNAVATVVAAVQADVDLFDAAMDSMSASTSQPSLGAIVAALEHTRYQTGLSLDAICRLSQYWAQVREQYIAFEPGIKGPSAEVYAHEIPGGQISNLQEQALGLGIDVATRWPEITQAYADTNELFGDIIKVTPSSKVVGDMALTMVSSGWDKQAILDPDKEINFPDSVISFFRGELGQPPGGFPQALQQKVLKGEEPLTVRPGSVLEAVDLKEAKELLERTLDDTVSCFDLASYLMYPDIYLAYHQARKDYGDVSILPTHVFFYGMQDGQEVEVQLEPGRYEIIRYFAMSDPDDEGMRRVFFEINGLPRSVRIRDEKLAQHIPKNEKAVPSDPCQIGAPVAGIVAAVEIKAQQDVACGDPLFYLEAMKMQTMVCSNQTGQVERIAVRVGQTVQANDLLMVFKQDL